jgi:hypothetical protein
MRGLTLAQKMEELAHNGERDVRSDRTEDNLGTQNSSLRNFCPDGSSELCVHSSVKSSEVKRQVK